MFKKQKWVNDRLNLNKSAIEGDFERALQDLSLYKRSVLEKFPEARNFVIELDQEPGYPGDNDEIVLRLKFQRKETDEEYYDRTQLIHKKTFDKEYEEYIRLRKKYEGK